MPTTMTRDASGNVWETKTKTTGKVEVRIRYCCCCSLRVAAILIGIYTLILYIIFLALASSSLARIVAGQPDPEVKFAPSITLRPDQNTIVVIDPYFDTLGLYTEELKFGPGSKLKSFEQKLEMDGSSLVRFPILIIDIVIYILVILAAIVLFVSICTEFPWLVLPWIGMMSVDIVRGTISVILIFVYSGGDIRKIAVGIFFLGLQLFHLSLVLIMIAYFQWLLAKSRGQEFPASDYPDRKSVMVEGSNIYPTMPTQYGYSNYAYSTSPHSKRDQGPHPSGYSTQPRDIPPARLQAITDSPSRYPRDDYGRPGPSGYREYSTHSSRQQGYRP